MFSIYDDPHLQQLHYIYTYQSDSWMHRFIVQIFLDTNKELATTNKGSHTNLNDLITKASNSRPRHQIWAWCFQIWISQNLSRCQFEEPSITLQTFLFLKMVRLRPNLTCWEQNPCSIFFIFVFICMKIEAEIDCLELLLIWMNYSP
jgi:hypothetical protein